MTSEVQPLLERRKFFLTNRYLVFVGWAYTHYDSSVKIRLGMIYGTDANNDLPVGAEEAIGIQLFGKLVQREVDDMFLTGFSDGKGYFILRIEISNITYLQRLETIYTRYKETGAILFFLWFEGVVKCIEAVFG